MNLKNGNSPDVVYHQATACTPAPILLNTLQFITPAKEVEVKFTAVKLPGMQCFEAADLPREAAYCTGSGLPSTTCYTRFGEKDEGMPVRMNLAQYPVVARAWLSHQVRMVLMPHVAYSSSHDGGSTQYWCAAGDNDGETPLYHRFTLKVENDEAEGRYRLVVAYDGQACLLNQTIFNLNKLVCDTMLYRQVAFRRKIYQWRRLPHHAHFHLEEMFPVLNHELAEVLGMSMPADAGSETYADSWQHISNFFSRYCHLKDFCRIVKHDGHLTAVLPEDTGWLAEAGKPLLFGERHRHTHAREGMQKYGPYHRPPGTHFGYFFIYFRQHQQEAKQFQTCLSGNNGLPHPGSLTCLSLAYHPQQNIVLSDYGQAEETLKKALHSICFDSRITWFAFYLCPCPKQEDEVTHNRLYHFIKEELLVWQVPVQTVKVNTIHENLNTAYNNIASALVAKLGGTPWLPEGFRRRELVVGFNTDSQKQNQWRYMAWAACMMQEGKFSQSGSMSPYNPLYMAGTAITAYQKYRNMNPAPERIVIHMPALPGPELKGLLTRMADMEEEDLPVVVMTIRTCRRDVLMAEGNGSSCMPADGRWIRYGSSTYLLSVGGSPEPAQADACEVFPLRIDLWCNRRGYLDKAGIADGLLYTVYAFTRIQWHSGRDCHLPVSITYPAKMAKRLTGFRRKALRGEELWFI